MYEDLCSYYTKEDDRQNWMRIHGLKEVEEAKGITMNKKTYEEFMHSIGAVEVAPEAAKMLLDALGIN